MKEKGIIVVIGSSNTDMIVKSSHLPLPGETVLGGKFFTAQGGKGANQAVAAARLGGHVTFVAKVGEDQFGNAAIDNYLKDGIDTTFITRSPDAASGVALILVDGKGENSIAVASGANAELSKKDIDAAAGIIRSASIVLMQLE
ncbi:MAG: ribokinase, partial [Alistipes sp.]|nr:ribokinase [Candidatus Minthomonas equi]